MNRRSRHGNVRRSVARVVGILMTSWWIAGCSGTGAPPPPAETESAPVRVVQGPPLEKSTATSAAKPVEKAARERYYTVKPKDTLYSIAAAHKVDVEQLVAWNQITKWQKLQIGQQLRVVVPNGKIEEAEKPPKPTLTAPLNAAQQPTDSFVKPSDSSAKATATPASETAKPGNTGENLIPSPSLAMREKPPQPIIPTLPDEGPGTDGAQKNLSPNPPQTWVWPHPGRIIGRFGQFGALRNTGIDIAANPGDPVVAAADGVVAYADQGLATYGNMILLRHGGSIMTAYAHVQKILVKQGQSVRAGETIALAGQSGVTVTPRLHFEVRRNIAPQNPLEFLPKRD
ncbi:MAG: M23 family metallopeptidase [Magnetococcus sp. YQC-9]